jgi:transcriptional regulator with XRE-family HTH domain
MPRQKSTHVDDPRAVGERLRAAREAAGLSQRQLAFAGCSPAYISRVESGDRIPSLQLLRELGRRLGVSEDYLATGSNPRERDGRMLEAEVALRLGDLELAESLYATMLDEGPGDAERAVARAGFGQIAHRRGDPRLAIEHFEAASRTPSGTTTPSGPCSSWSCSATR